MRWLEAGTPEAVSAALRLVAPELGDKPIVFRAGRVEADPVWWSASAVVGRRFVVKFAWSEPAALRLAHEIAVLASLQIPFLPEVVASSTDPVLLVTALVPGATLFDVVDSIDRADAGRQLAQFLAALHGSSIENPPPAALPPATAEIIRERFPTWVRPDQRSAVRRWCDWADDVLATPQPQVLVHGDLHGGNQVWYDGQLRVVVDFETVGLADPEYDLRLFPSTGPRLEVLASTLWHYTGRPLNVGRIMAWHVRTVLGDALWRSEAGVPLPDHRTPEAWVDDLTQRFSALRIRP
ncbi:aminoglycoside phosphotransferase family protein [Kribbella sp. NPDC058245]|uniref:aminoglycoside phosphotransferase family protein n=1 Tax=Kribbella sp. NPDC058245 TaxID=3346399 RepID=UPI0036E541C9